MLHIWFLEVGGKRIAYNFDAEFEGNLETLKCSYDENYGQYSPGILLDYREFERALQRSTKSINLLWGNEEYKRHWSTRKKSFYEVFLFNHGFLPYLIYFFCFRLSLYQAFRPLEISWKRLLRKLGFHPQDSELTRMDQINHSSD